MDFQDNSKAVKKELDKRVKKALTMLGYKWQEIAAMEIDTQPRFGPDAKAGALGMVDTGRLRASMDFGVDTPNKLVTVGSDVEYAIYVFMGTWKMAARPALQNSVLNYADDYRGVVEDALGS